MVDTGLAARSLKASTLQSLHPNEETVSVPIKQLDAVESAVEEQEQIAEANVALKLRLHERVKTIEAFSHIDVFRVQKNPGGADRRRNPKMAA